MKRFSEQLNKRAQSVKLRASEKRELRERVVSYMEYHPLSADMKVSNNVSKKQSLPVSEPFTTFQIPFRSIFKYSSFTAVLMMLVVPFVAEKAVPGDVLYSVKVQFNEELRSTLTFDTYRKVEWETERLNRRIAEARLLASEGRLTEKAEADVAQAVRVHSANAQREIETLRFQDEDAATIASITLDTTLELQSSSFRGKDESSFDSATLNAGTVNLIATAIDESRIKSDENTASTSLPAYDRLMARVEQNTTRIQELFSALKKVAPADDLVDVQRRIEDIDRAIVEALEIYYTDEIDSRTKLVTIIQRTQRLIVYMNELGVVKTVDIKTLIPVILTPAEQQTQREAIITELSSKILQIDELTNQTENTDIKEKAIFARNNIDMYLIEMNSASTSFAAFVEISINATNLANDSIRLLTQDVAEIIPETPEELDAESASSTEGSGSTTESSILPIENISNV